VLIDDSGCAHVSIFSQVASYLGASAACLAACLSALIGDGATAHAPRWQASRGDCGFAVGGFAVVALLLLLL
jgi:hypothetical protein